MAYEPGALDAALAAVVGDDPQLVTELRAALLDSAERNVDLLARARCDANWYTVAWRIKGLAASFGAMELLSAAEMAIESAPGDPVAIRTLRAAVQDI
jgi:HPt (histidine-containing phosphotransfer) domain-containing protein